MKKTAHSTNNDAAMAAANGQSASFNGKSASGSFKKTARTRSNNAVDQAGNNQATTLESIPAILLRRAGQHPDRVALRVKRSGQYHDINWLEYGANVCECAAGLMALGLERGETVALMCGNRPEFAYADLGVLIAGGITVAIYTSTSAQGLT
jgi:long-subunit acyl-CoA synthetase (AMP-forming)